MTTKPIPAIKAGVAIQSLRHSGYDISTALGEPIDNSLEAGANNIHIQLADVPDARGRRHVNQVAIIDDGSGMDADTLQHYLQLGFSTRYMRTDTIGKFGVGAKLAALTFARRIDAWSRASKDTPWVHVQLDLDEAANAEKAAGEVNIEPPAEYPLPPEYADIVPKGTGTIVVWSKIDRLDEGRHASSFDELRVEIEKELARIFRYFIRDGRQLLVNGRALLPHDPLFLMERSWTDSVLSDLANVGVPKKARKEVHAEAFVVTKDEEVRVHGCKALLTVTVYPTEVVRERGKGGDEIAKKLRIPDNEGAISFVRMDREISYTNVPKIFPGGVETRDRFIGIEVRFKSEADEYFGVRNVKRGVEPHGELRAEVRKRLQKYLPQARERIEGVWGASSKAKSTHDGEISPVVVALKEADRTLPKPRAPQASPKAVETALEELAVDVGKTEEKEKETYKAQAKGLPYIVEMVAFPGTNFVEITHLGSQILIKLNTRHRFYRELWEPLIELSKRSPADVSGDEAVRMARRSIEALSLLIVAYSKAESMHDDPHGHYSELRDYWGKFMDSLFGKVKDVL
jgi:hypothetical protein